MVGEWTGSENMRTTMAVRYVKFSVHALTAYLIPRSINKLIAKKKKTYLIPTFLSLAQRKPPQASA